MENLWTMRELSAMQVNFAFEIDGLCKKLVLNKSTKRSQLVNHIRTKCMASQPSRCIHFSYHPCSCNCRHHKQTSPNLSCISPVILHKKTVKKRVNRV